MNKLKLVALFATIIALTVVSGAAKKPADPDHSATEYAVFGDAPGGWDIQGEGVVGTNVWTYSPITLLLSDRVALVSGEYSGFARCLKKNGPEGARLDFFFGGDYCDSNLNTCDYRLVVRGGIYDRKPDIDVFDPGSVLLDYKGNLEKEGTASFTIAYSEVGGGGEEPTGLENGCQCKDGKDNDGDGDIDCDDPDCSNTKWCQ